MKKLKKNKNKGILFWITGLSGSGKTTIAKKIKKDIMQLYGPTLLVSGDNIRKIFKFNKYIMRGLQIQKNFVNLRNLSPIKKLIL